MKIKLLEDNKIIIVPSCWKYKIIEGKKVIIDQLGNVIGIVIEEKE
jgi:hypothetical protein